MTPQELAQLFSIFHDGALALVSADDDLALTVEIPYLARRVDPAFTHFAVRLERVADLRFVGWATPDVRTDPEEIFGQALEIYRADVEGDAVAVSVSTRADTAEDDGGTLYFQAERAIVRDENGRPCTLAELDQICAGYWDDFGAKDAPSAHPYPS